jgi:hypothetical protein
MPSRYVVLLAPPPPPLSSLLHVLISIYLSSQEISQAILLYIFWSVASTERTEMLLIYGQVAGTRERVRLTFKRPLCFFYSQ